jgi:hypothetical protein
MAFVFGYTAGVVDKSETDYAAMLGVYFDAVGPDVAAKKSIAVMDQSLSTYGAVVSKYCIPKGVVLGQITEVFCNYLRSNPANRHLGGDVLLNKSLAMAWPCSQTKPEP